MKSIQDSEIENEIDRILKDEAWFRGVLAWKLQSHQDEIYSFLKTRTDLICVLLLSRRFGKTHIAFVEDCERCISQPDSRVAYFYPTLKQGKQIIHPIADIVFEDAPSGVVNWLEMESCYQFSNGSKIFIFGCDTMRDIDRHRGPKYSSIRIDEAGVHHYLNYLYKSVLLPTMLTMTEKPLITFMGTPSPNIEHDFRMIFEEANLRGNAIIKTLDENTAVDEETKEKFIEESGGRESTETRREYFCEWVVDSELAVIPEWSDEYIEELNKLPEFKFYNITASMDVGGRDQTAIVWGYYDFVRSLLIIEHEAILSGQETTVDSIADAIHEIEGEHYKGKTIHRWADNNAIILLQDLSSNHAIGFNPTGKDLKLAMVGELRVLINSGRLRIHPRCQHLIGCLRTAIWDSTKTNFQRSAMFGHFDALDALIYLVRNLNTTSNPIPANYGINVNHVMFPKRLETKKSLARMFRK